MTSIAYTRDDGRWGLLVAKIVYFFQLIKPADRWTQVHFSIVQVPEIDPHY